MFNIGDKVRWHDVAIDEFPVEERIIQESRIYEVVEDFGEGVYLIADDYSDAEVCEEELELVEVYNPSSLLF